MRISKLATVAAALLLTACSITLPVRGQFQDGDETFTGSARGGWDRSGTLTVTSTKGLTCSGDFIYTSPRTGEGTFLCSDRRSGPFSFVSNGMRGTGTGTLGGQPFTFTFGN